MKLKTPNLKKNKCLLILYDSKSNNLISWTGLVYSTSVGILKDCVNRTL